jgi:hypothetical protein
MNDSDVYMLTPGHFPLGYEAKWRKLSGKCKARPAMKSSPFVAHFRRDGTYGGSVPLNLPFKPIHLGVFGDGDFLIAGTDKDGPRLAIVGSNGQFRRFVELKGDVHARDESDKPGRQKDPTALPRIPSGDDAEGSHMEVLGQVPDR